MVEMNPSIGVIMINEMDYTAFLKYKIVKQGFKTQTSYMLYLKNSSKISDTRG